MTRKHRVLVAALIVGCLVILGTMLAQVAKASGDPFDIDPSSDPPSHCVVKDAPAFYAPDTTASAYSSTEFPTVSHNTSVAC